MIRQIIGKHTYSLSELIGIVGTVLSPDYPPNQATYHIFRPYQSYVGKQFKCVALPGRGHN